MFDQPLFWICAIISVIVTGISKGGFGGIALLAVPLMSLVISPVQAAGIMLPILIVMDWVSLWAYRKSWDKALLLLMIPASLVGVALAWSFAAYLDDQFLRLCVGLIALLFPIYAVLKPRGRASLVKNNKPLGFLAGAVAGVTSFIAHAGGPLFQAYAIPQELEKKTYVGTGVIFFAVLNFVKLLPYAMLGQFDKSNLTTSLVLMPLAPIGVLIGVWLVNRINQDMFYRILYGIIFCVGLKLLWDAGHGFTLPL